MTLAVMAVRAVIELEKDARGCLRKEAQFCLHRKQHRSDLFGMTRVQNKLRKLLYWDLFTHMGVFVEDYHFFEGHPFRQSF